MIRTLIERVVATYVSFWARLVFRARRPLIVGVTGSVGKTTTKEVIAAALEHGDVRALVGPIWKTPGNLNNSIGLPLSLLGAGPWPESRLRLAACLAMVPARALAMATFAEYPRILVLEYAAGPKGDVARMAALAPPTVAVVTAIGPAHLEHFGTIESIVRAKGALVRHVPSSGLVVLGGDNRYAASLDRYARARVLKVPGRGRALSENVARAVCAFLGVPEPLIARALAEPTVVPGRLATLDLGCITVVDDAFNANPLSMELGLDTLAERDTSGGRRVAILGEMKELGVDAPRYHAEIGAYARSRADVVVGVGALARRYEPDSWFPTSAACAAALPGLVAPGDCVLVKGSHAVGLDRVVDGLTRWAHAVAAGRPAARSTASPASENVIP